MSYNGRRGRPQSFSQEDRRNFAELIRQFGARGARQASEGTVSVGTLLKIAREFGIALKKGRRPHGLPERGGAAQERICE